MTSSRDPREGSPKGTANPERQVRCRVLSQRTQDRCPNPAVTDFGACLKHLQEFHAEYQCLLNDLGLRKGTT